MSLLFGGQITLFNPSNEDADVEVTTWYTPTYGTRSTALRVRVPARRLAIVHSYGDPDAEPCTPPYISGQTVAVRSLPRADGRPGPDIVVGRGTNAGAEGSPNARLDPFIAIRMK